MKRICIVGGTSGTGKSTLISHIKDDVDVTVISTGDVFNTVLNKLFSIDIARDKIKNTNWKAFEPYVMVGLCSIVEHIKIKNLVIDTHYAVNSPGGFVSGLNDESIHFLGWTIAAKGYVKCDCILIDASPEEIQNRIILDNNRRRSLEDVSIEALREERNWNLEFQKRYIDIFSKYVQTNKIVVDNTDLSGSIIEFKNIFQNSTV